MIFCFKMAKDQLFKHRKNINPFSTPVCQIDIFVKLYLDFANDWGKNGKNGGYHVIEHLLMNKSRGGTFFKIFLFFLRFDQGHALTCMILTPTRLETKFLDFYLNALNYL